MSVDDRAQSRPAPGESTLMILLLAVVGWLVGVFLASVLNVPASAGSCSTLDQREDNVGVQNNWTDNAGTLSEWFAGGANDDLSALACDDPDVQGEGEQDIVGAGSGDDLLGGGANNDTLRGGADNDDIGGGNGRDDVFDVESSDSDEATTGSGDDEIDFKDGDHSDNAQAGADEDTCHLNTNDLESGCEHID